MSEAGPSAGQASGFEAVEDLRRMCLGAEVPWSLLAPFVSAFGESLRDNHRVSVEVPLGRLGLSTVSSGQMHVYRALRFMEQQGTPSEVVQPFLSLAKHFDSQEIRIGISIDARSLRELTTEFACQPAMDVVHAMLADAGMAPEQVGLVEATAEIFEQHHAHTVGFSSTRKGPHMKWVRFVLDDADSSWDRVRSAALLLGVTDVDWAPIAAAREHVDCQPVCASVGLAASSSVLAVSWGGLSPRVVETLMREDRDIQLALLPRVVASPSAQKRVEVRVRSGGPIFLKTSVLG